MAGAPLAMPSYLEPVLSFVNTIDVEDGTEALADPAALAGWLRAQGLLGVAGTVTPAQFRLALELRGALRAFMLANNGVEPSTMDLTVAARCFSRLPAVASAGSAPLQAAARNPVLAALTELVVGYATARAAGEWSRLRRCPAEDCAWVFWDSSPRAARRWCSMRVCGNRAKARTYAARQTRP